MKLKSVFFYQAVKVGTQMINSASDEHYEIELSDNVTFVTCPRQQITVAVPMTNIPQMQLKEVRRSQEFVKMHSNLEKARAAAAAKRQARAAFEAKNEDV